jgi:hypothetical protein
MRSKNLETNKVTEGVVCPRCGFKNLSGAKFCSSCGLSFKPTLKGRFDGSVALLLAGSFYLLISLLFNAIIQQVWYFAVPAAVSGLLGLYAANQMYKGQMKAATFAIALTSVVIGFAVTLIVFLIGLGIQGVFGPAWIIFALTGYWLYRSRSSSGIQGSPNPANQSP